MLANAPVRVERVGLATAAIQGEHQLLDESLARRMAPDERLELADEHGVPAELQIGVDARLVRRQSQLLQAPDLRLRPILVGDVDQRPAAPQRERGGQHLRRLCRVAMAQRAAAVLDARFEQLGIELARLYVEHVSAGQRAQRRRLVDAGARRQHLAQARDRHPQALASTVRGQIAPHRLDELLGHHRTVGVQQQHHEQPRLASTFDGQSLPTTMQLDRPEDRVSHNRSLDQL